MTFDRFVKLHTQSLFSKLPPYQVIQSISIVLKNNLQSLLDLMKQNLNWNVDLFCWLLYLENILTISLTAETKLKLTKGEVEICVCVCKMFDEWLFVIIEWLVKT